MGSESLKKLGQRAGMITLLQFSKGSNGRDHLTELLVVFLKKSQKYLFPIQIFFRILRLAKVRAKTALVLSLMIP